MRSDCECKEFRVDGEFHKILQAVTLDTIEILGFTISVLEIYLLSSVFRSRQRLQYALLVMHHPITSLSHYPVVIEYS